MSGGTLRNRGRQSPGSRSECHWPLIPQYGFRPLATSVVLFLRLASEINPGRRFGRSFAMIDRTARPRSIGRVGGSVSQPIPIPVLPLPDAARCKIRPEAPIGNKARPPRATTEAAIRTAYKMPVTALEASATGEVRLSSSPTALDAARLPRQLPVRDGRRPRTLPPRRRTLANQIHRGHGRNLSPTHSGREPRHVRPCSEPSRGLS